MKIFDTIKTGLKTLRDKVQNVFRHEIAEHSETQKPALPDARLDDYRSWARLSEWAGKWFSVTGGEWQKSRAEEKRIRRRMRDYINEGKRRRGLIYALAKVEADGQYCNDVMMFRLTGLRRSQRALLESKDFGNAAR